MATTGEEAGNNVETESRPDIFFIKQPILDKNRRIWGYELLGAELRKGIYEVFSQHEDATNLSSTAYLGLQEAMLRGKKISVAFDANSILEGLPHVLPRGLGVVRVLNRQTFPHGFWNALQELRKAGYLVAIDHDQDSIEEETYAQIDILSHEFVTTKPNFLNRSAAQAKTQLLVRGIESLDQFVKAQEMGFNLYQGSFFKKSRPIPGRKLSSNQVSRINLFHLIEDDDPDLKALAEAISSDVSISFRLLSYLNSPFFGLLRKIQSINQAIILLGWKKLKVWLRAVLLADMAGQEEIPRELAALSLQRAKFLELLASKYDWWGFNPESLFLLGIFSLLDAILEMSMADLAEKLPLDHKLKAALRRDASSEYMPLFHLLYSLEDGDWVTLQNQTQKLGLELEDVKTFHTQSRNWSEVFFSFRENT